MKGSTELGSEVELGAGLVMARRRRGKVVITIVNSGLLTSFHRKKVYVRFTIFCETKSSLTLAAGGVLSYRTGSYTGCGVSGVVFDNSPCIKGARFTTPVLALCWQQGETRTGGICVNCLCLLERSK